MGIRYVDVVEFVNLVLYCLLIIYMSSVLCRISKSMMMVSIFYMDFFGGFKQLPHTCQIP